MDSAGTTSTTGGRPQDANTTGGAPDSERDPTTDDPYQRSDGTVTTDTAGYSNAMYSGKPGKVIDVMQDIQESEDDDQTEKSRRLRRMYNECVRAVNNEIPSYEDIERSIRTRPDKNYRAFKRNHGGAWSSRVDTDHFVKQMYEFVESQR